MARRRHNNQRLRRGRASCGRSTDDSCDRLSSEDEVSDSDDASLLEVDGAIFVSSDDDMGEKEEMTESSDASYGEQNSRLSSESVDRTSDQFTRKVNSDSGRGSMHEVTSDDVDAHSGEDEASVSVEDSSEETMREMPKGKEKAVEEEDGDCIVQEVDAVEGGVNKKNNEKKRCTYNFSLPDAFPVGWRTRSFTKNGKRVDYTPYYNYKNTIPVAVPDSEEGSDQFEEFDSESGSESCTDSDSGSHKLGCQPKERIKYGKHSAGKGFVYSSGTGTRGTLQRKRAGTHKGVGVRTSSMGCSSDFDDVPILERLNKIRKQNSNDEGCSWAPFEEFDMVSVSTSDDANGTVGNVRNSKRFAKEKRFGKSKYKKRRRHEEIPDKKLLDFLMRSLDADGGDALKSSQYNLPRELPMVFNFGTDTEPLKEKSEFEGLVDEAWADFEFALGVEKLGSYKPDKAITREDAVYIATGNYCSNGEHGMHLDERIGYKCQHCCYIETEIRDIFPDFAKLARNAPAGRNQMDDSDSLRFCDLHRKPGIQEMPHFPKTGTVWDLIPGLIDTMYPHQKEAFEFMWHNLAGGIQLEELHSVASQSDKLGCFISHAPGTGKTRLAIVFIQSYMKAFPNCHPVVIAPANLLKTWENEFKKWGVSLPFHDMNSEDFTGKEDIELLDIADRRPHTMDTRMIKLLSWLKGNSVLGISYSLFSKYISRRSNARSKVSSQIGNALVEKPGILIMDEAHIPRNENSQSWNALSEVKTKKRILLSGTPFQNNFLELYNTLCLVRPEFVKNSCLQTEKPNKMESLLHKKKSKSIKDIWTTPTRSVTAANAEEIRAMLKPIVHVYNGEVLQSLPKRECVIILNPEEVQGDVIQKLGQAKNSNTFDRECKISLASIHPCLLASTKLTGSECSFLDKDILKNLGDDPYAGVKTKFVIEFIQLLNSNPLEERVLIFSQYIKPLKLLKKQLTKLLLWSEGSEVLEIHGKIPLKERERSITSFNDVNSKARVLLASTKACSEGISLIGASRVVLLDVVWNPSVGKQAISRAWRIGQQRVVYTYNLITAGTDEMEKYDVQMQKEKLSKLVFSPKDFVPSLRKGTGDQCDLVPEDRVLAAMTSSEALKGMFSNIYYCKSSNWRFSSGLEDLSRKYNKTKG